MVSSTQVWKPSVEYIPVYDANLAVRKIADIASANQTVFNLVGVSYIPGTNSILVFRNGVLQALGVNYIEEDPITIRFTSGLAAGDRVVFVCFTEINLYTEEPYNTAVRVDVGQGPLNTLPLKAERAGKFLSFDANGQPQAVISSDDVAETLALVMAALEELGDVNEALALKAPINNPVFTGTVGGITKAMVGLDSVDNTSDLAKPISTATAAAITNGLAQKLNITDFNKTGIGLGNVDNTSDAAKPVSTATQTALNLKANLASPTFTGTPSAPTPAVGTNSTRLATTAFVAAAVAAVPVVTKESLGLGNVDNTSDVNKPVSTATQTALAAKADTTTVNTALALKAPLASPTFTGTVSGITKAMVGLGNVDNTTDAAKPISTATQTALDLKANTSALATYAPLASPALTGTPTSTTQAAGNNTTRIATTAFVTTAVATGVAGVTKASIGLGNVDNTSDMDKPVSTATQNAIAAIVAGDLEPALAGKANVNNTNLTGTMTAEAANFSGAVAFSGAVTGITKAAVGLGNVDNTADSAKPVSTAQATALALKANIASPTFTGSPAVPLPAAADNTNRIASTSWVNTAITTGLGTVTKASVGLGNVDNTSDANKPVSTAQQAAIDLKVNTADLNKAAVGLSNVDNTADTAKPVSTAQQTALNLKANLASPALTGTPTAPTAAAGTNTTQLATTAHVLAGLNLKSNLASPTFTGTPAAPTAAAGTSTTQLATTAFVTAADNLKANLASPALTGTPTAPTAAVGTNSTQLATTAHVTAGLALQVSLSDLQNWSTYTPTVTPTSGTYNATSATGRYIRFGNFVMFNITGTVTDKGTGAVPTINLPFNIAAGDFNIFAGRASGGSMVQAQGSAGSSRVTVFTYNNANPLDTSTSFTIQGCFLCS